MTSADPEVWDAALNNVENVQRALGIDVTEISVVAHGKGIGLVMKTNTVLAGKIARLATPHVKFVACENTMKRLRIQKDDLLAVAGTIDSGVAEVVRLQEAGSDADARRQLLLPVGRFNCRRAPDGIHSRMPARAWI